jgi:riboflavin kinase / FMN adenylyltransferase
MRITQQMDDLSLEGRPVVFAVGSFDGVHRGHQQVIGRAVDLARQADGESWALTLDPHPLKILKPDAAPPLITSTLHKLRLIENLGVDGCVVMPFTLDVAAEEPDHFLKRLKRTVPGLSALVVGENWTFGHHGRGDVSLLKKLAPALSFEASVVPPVLWENEAISSSRVRQAVMKGRLAEARETLGRSFSILGTVVSGKRIGRQLGFPTANLDPHNEVRPPSGVYAVKVLVNGRRFKGAAFLAESREAPITPSGFVTEVHILDFEEDIYGADIEALFIEWIRAPRHFETRGALKKQIGLDVRQASELLDGTSFA